MPCDLRQPPFAVDAVRPDMPQECHDVLEGVFVGQPLLRQGAYDGIEHLERKVVDEQPRLERILVAHVACRAVQRVVVRLEDLLYVLPRLVQAVRLGAVQFASVGLQDERAVAAVRLERLRHVHGCEALVLLPAEAPPVLPPPAVLGLAFPLHGAVRLLRPHDEIDGLVVGEAHVVVQEKPVPARAVFVAVYGAPAEPERLFVPVRRGRDLRDARASAAHGEHVAKRRVVQQRLVQPAFEPLVGDDGHVPLPEPRVGHDVGEGAHVRHVARVLLVVDRQLPGAGDAEHVQEVHLREEAAPAVVADAGVLEGSGSAYQAVPVEHDQPVGGQVPLHVSADGPAVRAGAAEQRGDAPRAQVQAAEALRQERSAVVEVHPPEARPLLAFQQRHGEQLPPAVGEQRGKPLAHGGGQAEQERGRPVLEVLQFAGGVPSERRVPPARLQAPLRYRPEAAAGLLPFPFPLLVVDAEALVKVPSVPYVLDFSPRGAVELGYPDWLVVHFRLLIHFTVSLYRLP